MVQSGQVVFSQMDEVVFGKPAAETIAEISQRWGATRVFLMVSSTLNKQTDEIEKIRRALGNNCVGTFDGMPPHTPRKAVIAAAEMARAANADLIVTIGGGSITDGAKAVALCLANDVRTPEGDGCPALDQGRRWHDGAAADEDAHRAPASRADDHLRWRVQRLVRRHRRAHESEGTLPARGHRAPRRHPRSRHHRAHAGMAVAVDGHSRRRPLRRSDVLQRDECLCRRARR